MHTNRRTTSKQAEFAKRLSFVTMDARGNRVAAWSVHPTGNWSEDTAMGRACASELVLYLQSNDHPFVLQDICALSGRDEARLGIEVGFFTQLHGDLRAP